MSQFVRSAKDFWAGIIYIVIGAAAILLSRDYGMGTAMKMGPAYFPTILSGLLIVIGCISFVRSFLKPGTAISAFGVKGLVLTITSIVLFGFLVRNAGLIIAVPALVMISSYASSRFRWKYSLILAAGMTMFCVLVFLKGLGVPIPILGLWFEQ